MQRIMFLLIIQICNKIKKNGYVEIIEKVWMWGSVHEIRKLIWRQFCQAVSGHWPFSCCPCVTVSLSKMTIFYVIFSEFEDFLLNIFHKFENYPEDFSFGWKKIFRSFYCTISKHLTKLGQYQLPWFTFKILFR